MSVRIRTPWPSSFLLIASSRVRLAVETSSSQPKAIASMAGTSPTILFAAATSSSARLPCVTTRSPTMRSFLLDIAMGHARRAAAFGQASCESFRGGDGAVLSSRAADRDGQVALPLPVVAGQEESHELVEAADELPVLLEVLEEAHNLGIATGLRLERLDEKGILDETNVHHDVRLHRDPVLVPEGDDRRV